MKQKSLFIIFKGLSRKHLKQTFLVGGSPTLKALFGTSPDYLFPKKCSVAIITGKSNSSRDTVLLTYLYYHKLKH